MKKNGRLNLLALPSFTAIFFTLIAAVIVGAALASLLPRSQVWWPAIVLPVLVLPPRDFLHGPDREAARHGLEPLAANAAPLSAELDRLSKGAGLNTPQAVSSETTPLYAFGTFRRHLVAISHGAKPYLADRTSEPK